METLFKTDDEYWVNSEAAAQLIGVEESGLQSWHYKNGQHFDKTDFKNQVGYNLKDFVKFIGKLEVGFFQSEIFENRDKCDPSARVLTDLKEVLDEDEFSQVFEVTTGMKVRDDDVLVIGETAVSIREGVEHLVRRDDDMDESEFERQLDHVKDICFGWADETNEECAKNCRLLSACCEERNKHLARYGEDAEARDVAAHKFYSMESRMSNIQTLRDNVSENFEKEWS